MNNNFEINSGHDTNVTVNQVDYGGKIALAIVQAIIGLIVFIVASPVLVPMMIMEGRSSNRQNRVSARDE